MIHGLIFLTDWGHRVRSPLDGILPPAEYLLSGLFHITVRMTALT
jgi:hypothetical protein